MTEHGDEGGAAVDPFHRGCCHWQGVHDGTEPEVEGAAYLPDFFSATVELRIAEIQPQYGLVQLNAMRRACGCLVSCDVKRDVFLAAVARVLNVTITTTPPASGEREFCSEMCARHDCAACPTPPAPTQGQHVEGEGK